MGNPELTKVSVAGAAGSQVIKPLLRFRQWHIMGCDSLESLGGWATCARGIRKLVEQTSPQYLQEAFFVTPGISHCDQKFLHSGDSNPLHR